MYAVLHASNFLIKEIEGQTMISYKQNVESKAIKIASTLLKRKIIEKCKLKRRLTETKI